MIKFPRRIRHQILFITAVLLAIIISGSSLSFLLRIRAYEKLEKIYAEDLRVLIELPRLRGELDKLNALTEEYVLTGAEKTIVEREKSLMRINGNLALLDKTVLETGEKEVLSELKRKLSDYLAKQQELIDHKTERHLAETEILNISLADLSFDPLIEELAGIRDRRHSAVAKEVELLRQTSWLSFLIVISFGISGVYLFAFLLTKFLTRPIVDLQKYMNNWEIGRKWEIVSSGVNIETDNLYRDIRGMSEKANLEYDRERELAEIREKIVYLVSHEYNNVIASLTLSTQALKEADAGKSDQRRQKLYDIIEREISSLHMTSRNLLGLGRMRSGKYEIELKPVNIGEVISKSVDLILPFSNQRDIQIHLDVGIKPVCVKIDADAMNIVLANLLSNAVKYTAENGEVVVGISVNEKLNRAKIYVRDTGIGIPKEDIDRLFQDYFRTENGKKRAKGIGLGLVMAKNIIELHGSSLVIESEQGKGSCFSFELPICRDEEK